jgi:hypothetical protein
LSRRAWLSIGGLAVVLLLCVVGVRLVQAWMEPWYQTRRVVSIEDQQVCVGLEDFESGFRSASERCFERRLISDGQILSTGDCVRLKLEDESARILDVTVVDCPPNASRP